MNKTPVRRFYKDDAELEKIHHNLKHTQCPHCCKYGALIFNGTASGYIEGEDRRVIRRQRVICNSLKKHSRGCGGCYCLFKSNIIPGIRVLAQTLWIFALTIICTLKGKTIWDMCGFEFDRRAAYHWCDKIKRGHWCWRVKLHSLSPVPEIASSKETEPFIATLIHFRTAFNKHAFINYQHQFQTSLFQL